MTVIDLRLQIGHRLLPDLIFCYSSSQSPAAKGDQRIVLVTSELYHPPKRDREVTETYASQIDVMYDPESGSRPLHHLAIAHVTHARGVHERERQQVVIDTVITQVLI